MAFSEKFVAVLENPEVVERFDGVTTEEEAIAIFKEYGIDYASEVAAFVNTETELSEDDLEQVAGGISIGDVKTVYNAVNKVLKWRFGVGAKQAVKDLAICARVIYDYARYKNLYRTYSKSTVQKIINRYK